MKEIEKAKKIYNTRMEYLKQRDKNKTKLEEKSEQDFSKTINKLNKEIHTSYTGKFEQIDGFFNLIYVQKQNENNFGIAIQGPKGTLELSNSIRHIYVQENKYVFEVDVFEVGDFVCNNAQELEKAIRELLCRGRVIELIKKVCPQFN